MLNNSPRKKNKINQNRQTSFRNNLIQNTYQNTRKNQFFKATSRKRGERNEGKPTKQTHTTSTGITCPLSEHPEEHRYTFTVEKRRITVL